MAAPSRKKLPADKYSSSDDDSDDNEEGGADFL